MKTYSVTIKREIVRVLFVEANSAKAAKEIVEEYGVCEAFSDFTCIDETIDETIKSVVIYK